MPTDIQHMVVNEVSLVDAGANQYADVILYKRADDALPGAVEDYLKRQFTAEERQAAASSGAAMPDGSYPIKDLSDLHNAIQAIGRAKNPAATKRHIISRARSLGATGELPADWKVGKAASAFESAAWGFRDAVADIIGDDIAKIAELDEYADEFRKLVFDGVPLSTPHGDPHMPTEIEAQLAKASSDLTKANADLATTRDTLAKANDQIASLNTLLALPAAHRDYAIAKSLTGPALAAFVTKAEKDRDMEVEDDKKKMEKAALDALPAHIRKQLDEHAVLMERINKAEAAAELASFSKRAVEHGLPESFGATLQKAYSADAAAVGELLTVIKGLTAQIDTSKLFETFGKSGGNDAGASPYQRIQAAAAELRKSNASMTQQQAVSEVMKGKTPEHRELIRMHKSARAA